MYCQIGEKDNKNNPDKITNTFWDSEVMGYGEVRT
jgi:predicted lipoprotein